MAAAIGNRGHVLAVPYPALGHVKPLMSLCRQIAKRGIKVTFVNSQTIHDKLASASAAEEEEEDDDDDSNADNNIVMATVPDGLTPENDPNSLFTLIQTLRNTMPQTLPNLVERINSDNPNEKISCVIADLAFSWIFDIAEKMGAEPVSFSPPSFASLAMGLHRERLLEQGYLDINGSLIKGDVISLSDDIPAWRKQELPWCFPGDPKMEKVLFELWEGHRDANKAKWWLCNTCYELEPAVTELFPNTLLVGPLNLLDSDTIRAGSRSINFYYENSSCLSWLDSKPVGSVVYVSFGSSAVFSQQQLDELALGLELSGRAFLWVVRPDLANGSGVVYPDGFLDRISRQGKIVEWAHQNRVLVHPSVGCFVSHCGWNSTIESVSRGVPFLCWSYFADQLHNEKYICDKWEIGLKISFDQDKIRSRYEIKKKIDMIFANSKFKENAMKLKEMCAKSVSDGGSSCKNLEKFIAHLRT